MGNKKVKCRIFGLKVRKCAYIAKTQCPAAGHTSVQLSDTGVSSCRTPTEIYNHNNNHDTNSRRPEIGFKSSVVGRNDANLNWKKLGYIEL